MIKIQRATRGGFSLLEILLALGLTVVVVTMIFAAIFQYLFLLTRQQADIEQKQVARGVLRMIGDDLGGAVQYKAEDYSALENLISSQSLAGFGAFANLGEEEEIDDEDLEQQILDAVAEGGGAGAGEGGIEQLGGGDEESDDEDSDEETDESEEEEELGRPALIGNTRLLRVDTSRLPRLDEYNPLVARRAIDQQLPSDVKTVTYFYSADPPVVEDEIMPEWGANGGLYRRRIDRAVEALLGDENVSDSPDEFCELVAPEVTGIQFRYFDGEEWLEEWDSAAMSGFPVAIEITVTMDPNRLSQQEGTGSTSAEEADIEVLRTVIYLPIAEIIEEEEEETVVEEDDR